MDDAPMLLTLKGKPDTTSRHVLQALAEFAHADGTEARPSLLRVQYRSGYDRRTVQRALRRLEDGKLITAKGLVNGCTNYTLEMSRVRPASDWASLKAEEERERAAAADRQRRARARRVTHSDDVTSDGVTDSASARHAFEARDVTHFASGCHALNAAQSFSEPPTEPPLNFGDGRRPTTGSEGARTGGSAARQDEHQEEVPYAAVGTVVRGFPKRLSGLFAEDRPIPAAVEGAIRQELTRGLTARQIISRVRRRYLEWGIERDIEAEDGDGVRTPVGALIRLIGAGNCTSARCDDGTDLDTAEQCRTCDREREDHCAVDRGPVQGAFPVSVPSGPTPSPAPRPSQELLIWRDCDGGCDRVIKAPCLPAPAGLCRDCRIEQGRQQEVSTG